MYDGWTVTDVQILRDRLACLQGKWVVTLNDTPDNRAVFKGCEIRPITRAMGINSKTAGKVYREVIIRPAAR